MDNKKDDWKSGKSGSNDMNGCGCGGGTSSSSSDKMNAGSSSSMNSQSSQQHYGQKDMDKKDHHKKEDKQQKNSMDGQSCESGIDGILITETVAEFYPLNDDISDDQMNDDLSNRLNEDSEDLTDIR